MSIEPSFRQITLTHIGGPTVFIEIGHLRLLTDPTFESTGYQYHFGAELSSKTSSPMPSPSVLGPVDTVLLSHEQHQDNLDPAGRAYLSLVRNIVTTPASAQRLGNKAQGVAPWEAITLVGEDGMHVRVTAAPALHGPQEIKEVIGDVNGWILEWEGQGHGALYISGDTILFPGIEEIARRYPIGLALLHFGASRRQKFGDALLTLTGEEGAQIAKMFGKATIIPIHYEGWSHLTQGRAEIEQAFIAAGLQQQLRFLPLGQAVSIET